MKPRSKIKMFTKDDNTNEMARTGVFSQRNGSKLHTYPEKESPARVTMKHWATSNRKSDLNQHPPSPVIEKTVTKIGFGHRSGDLSTRSRNPSETRSKKTGGGTVVNDYLRIEGKSPRGSPVPKAADMIEILQPDTAIMQTPSKQHVDDQQTPFSTRENSKKNLHMTKEEQGPKSKSNHSRNPKVIVNNQMGVIHSISRDILNDDMREVFTADSQKNDESMPQL